MTHILLVIYIITCLRFQKIGWRELSHTRPINYFKAGGGNVYTFGMFSLFLFTEVKYHCIHTHEDSSVYSHRHVKELQDTQI